ncbi:MMPL family transporter [Antrihabitans cavernicola]|uniref:MMPL family transporter n=1 Tax=Antrihabitans cavernicola TaxID=2495913 RepID=A0A5A7S512_9NOCA|nr:MMPL family transporter [Spelaeibacter cavernicola]KAA0016316.1 MMPL family transporter [Spelaeibacter cavernicola]
MLDTEQRPTPPPTTQRRQLERGIASFTARHKWPLAIVWLILLGVGGASGVSLTGSLSSGGWWVAASDSVTASQQIQTGFVGRGLSSAVLLVHDRDNTASNPAFDQRTRDVFDQVTADPRMHAASSFGWSTLSPANRAPFLGKDGATALTTIGMNVDDDAATVELPSLTKEFTQRFDGQGLDVSIVSGPAFWGEVNEQSTSGLIKAELITLPLIVLILLVLFRSVAAVLASLAVGVTSIVLTLGILSPIARHVELSIFVENVVTMLGLGVGIDYSLFMIRRFKEELAIGGSVEDSIAASLRTSGHTVVASGLTIVVAMSTVAFIRLNAITSMAVGAIAVVAVSILVATLLLPVLLNLLGRRIDAGRVPLPRRFRLRPDDADPTTSFWYRSTMTVMRRPLIFLVAGAAALLALAIPLTHMKLFLPDSRILSSPSAVRHGFDTISEQYGPGYGFPIQVVVSSSAQLQDTATDLASYTRELSGLPDVAAVQSATPVLERISPADPMAALNSSIFGALPPDARNAVRHYVSDDNKKFIVEVISAAPGSDERTTRLVERVRDITDKLPNSVHGVVGGVPASAYDANKEIERGLPWVLVFMLTAVYLLLLLTFRSVFLPLKAIAMNLLSVGATYGIMVMLFQYGWGAGLLGISVPGYQMNFVPVLLLAILFSLSTDYEVFLLSRVKEEYRAGADNSLAVARGMTHTAPLISGAALLMVTVFGAFGIAGILPIQQIGIGMAIAIALDATLVRMVLVPAAMRLMGRWNWWWPGRLKPPATTVAHTPRTHISAAHHAPNRGAEGVLGL